MATKCHVGVVNKPTERPRKRFCFKENLITLFHVLTFEGMKCNYHSATRPPTYIFLLLGCWIALMKVVWQIGNCSNWCLCWRRRLPEGLGSTSPMRDDTVLESSRMERASRGMTSLCARPYQIKHHTLTGQEKSIIFIQRLVRSRNFIPFLSRAHQNSVISAQLGKVEECCPHGDCLLRQVLSWTIGKL